MLRFRLLLRRWADAIELPTWLLAGGIYGGWIAVTAAYHDLPWWLVLAAGGWLVAWQGSLQHEAIHGHPTRHPRANAALAGLPLSLWIPYGVYRDLHLAHHRSVELTDPLEDPESFYVSRDRWDRLGPLGRAFLRAHATLLGRVILGPPRAVFLLWKSELARLLRGDRRHLTSWALHAAGGAAVLYWVLAVARIPLWAYLLLFVYPGLALTLVRSYAEHRAEAERPHRTAILEAGPLLGLLYLHNNLHAVHHARPHLPWYELPRYYRNHRERILEKNGGYFIPGYLALLRRAALRPHQDPVYPLEGGRHGPRSAAS